MTINKIYIDRNYEYISLGYIDLVNSLFKYTSTTGRYNENLREDIISLEHYLMMITQFAKYYAYLRDSISGDLFVYLQALDNGVPAFLTGSDGYYLITLNSDYAGISESASSDDTGIVNQFLVNYNVLLEDLTLTTNIDQSGFLSKLSYPNTVSVDVNDAVAGIDFDVDTNKISAFVLAVEESIKIIYKYSNKRYSNRVL